MKPEELEQVKKAKENLLEIMKADREVQAMLSEEQFEALISKKMEETDLTREDAELLVKRDQGLLGRSRPVFSPPAEDPITKAVKELVAERIKDVLAPGKGDVGDNKGKGPDLAQTLKMAKEQNVGSFMLPDGTFLNLNPKDPFGEELIKDTLNWGREKLQAMLKGGGGGGDTDLSTVQSPEMLKIILDDRAKTAEIEATKTIAQSKNDALAALAMLGATLISPEGYAKVKGMVDLALGKVKQGQGETPAETAETPADDKFARLPCLNPECKHVNIVQIGTRKHTCTECGAEQEQDW